jgi:hypothetical protein
MDSFWLRTAVASLVVCSATACGERVIDAPGPTASAGAGATSSGVGGTGGACPSTCAGACCAGVCTGGLCLTKLASAEGTGPIALDSTAVYWMSGGTTPNGFNDAAVLKCAIGGCGGKPTVIAAGNSACVPSCAIAVGASAVYWADTSGNILSCPTTGCQGAPAVFAAATAQGSVLAIASDATSLYWNIMDDYSAAGALMKCPLSGCGAPVTLATDAMVLSSFVLRIANLAVDATSVYWIDSWFAALMKCDINGCGTNPTKLYSAPFAPSMIPMKPQLAGWVAVDATSVYWTEAQGCSILKCATGGCGSSPTILAAMQPYPYGLAVDATKVYWSTTELNPYGPGAGACGSSADRVMACDASGCNGAPTTLAASQQPIGNLVVDATSAYWAAADGVMKLTPK